MEELGKEALANIGASFKCEVRYGTATGELTALRRDLSTRTQDSAFLFIKNPVGKGRFIEGQNRFFVLNDIEWQANKSMTLGISYVGSFVYEPSAILLHSSSNPALSWCRNTLIHETLHSASLYSRVFGNPNGIIPLHKLLNEGITECLNGYILLKKHPDCYNAWKTSTNGRCGISYRLSTKLFCSLAQVVGITPFS